MSATVIRGHPGVGPASSGLALVARDNFSARYDLDRIKGVFSRPTHKLHGVSYLGRVLVLNAAKGGVATAWMRRWYSAISLRSRVSAAARRRISRSSPAIC